VHAGTFSRRRHGPWRARRRCGRSRERPAAELVTRGLPAFPCARIGDGLGPGHGRRDREGRRRSAGSDVLGDMHTAAGSARFLLR
jgi:hypothetical protein